MAKVKQVKVSFGQTINTGNYENFRIEGEYILDLENEDESKIYDEYFKKLVKEVNQRATFLKTKLKNNG